MNINKFTSNLEVATKKNSINPSSPKKKAASASSMRLVLENRLLFDGAVMATAEVLTEQKQAQDDHAAQPDSVQDPGHDASVDDGAPAFGNHFGLDPQPDVITHAALAGTWGASNLLIVDALAESLAQLLQTPPANTDIRILAPDQDGYQQIASILQDRGTTANVEIQTGDIGGKHWR